MRRMRKGRPQRLYIVHIKRGVRDWTYYEWSENAFEAIDSARSSWGYHSHAEVIDVKPATVEQARKLGCASNVMPMEKGARR